MTPEVPVPRIRLKLAIRACGVTSKALQQLCKESGIDLHCIERALKGKAISADAYLSLCAATGIDPVNGKPCAPHQVGNIIWGFLGYGLKITRGLRYLSTRDAASLAGVSHTIIVGIEAGRMVSTASLLKICAFMNVHPEGYTTPLCAGRRIAAATISPRFGKPDVSRETFRRRETSEAPCLTPP